MLFKQKEPEIFSMRSSLSAICIPTQTVINIDISDKIKTDFDRIKHDENLKKIEEHIDEIVRLAASCNLSKQEIMEMVHFSLEEQG